MEPGQFTGAAVALTTLLAALCAGLVWRRGNGRFRTPAAARDARPHAAGGPAGGSGAAENGSGAHEADTARDAVLTAEDIGAALGERATLVQFSTAFCQPCRATRRVLAEVGAMVDGVAHTEIDAESRLDLVRRLDILRTPTVLVLDAGGRVVRRASGQPRKADVIAALGAAVDRDAPPA
ncbi:thioredoxin family protein [Nocardiopsis mangrovi]|uniref:Thioredoxin family protein n=1 Tax=Nocardiopsis mangrovi TaxID=1179818 RepID=A0ABV9DUY4_9ACTN